MIATLASWKICRVNDDSLSFMSIFEPANESKTSDPLSSPLALFSVDPSIADVAKR